MFAKVTLSILGFCSVHNFDSLPADPNRLIWSDLVYKGCGGGRGVGQEYSPEQLAYIMHRLGVDVLIRGHQHDILEKFNNGRFDLVITDICMPVVSGNSVVKYIQHSTQKTIPVLGISGTPFYMNAGSFNATLNKPLHVKPFLQTVSTLLNSST